MFAFYFLPDQVRKKLKFWVYLCCFVSVIIMIIQLLPFDWAGYCGIGGALCGSKLCSVSGNWHIAWLVPLNGLTNQFTGLWYPFPTYFIAGLLLPFLYGSWKLALFHLILGSILANFTTSNMNEWPAVWCLLSIGILMIAVKTPLRAKLHVKKWFLWSKSWN